MSSDAVVDPDSPEEELDPFFDIGGSTEQEGETESDRLVSIADPDPVEAEPLVVARFGMRTATVQGVNVDAGMLLPTDWDFTPATASARVEVREDRDNPGHWLADITWEPAPEAAFYRVIASDGEVLADSFGDNVEATIMVSDETTLLDSTAVNQPSAAVRHYEIWAFRGEDVESAMTERPYLHAEGQIAWPPINLEATTSGGQIILRWDRLPGLAVRVARRTVAELRKGKPSPAEAVRASNDDGHVLEDATQGVKYCFFAYAVHDAASDVPATVFANLPVQLEPVLDLVGEQAIGDAERITLTWSTVPDGDVRIFQSLVAPSADIHNAGQLPLRDLEQAPYNLTLSDPLRHPLRVEDATTWMENVDVTSDSAAVYFTPVTIHGNEARPGKTFTFLKSVPPSDLEIHDRVDRVLLAFKWPLGARRVDLWRTGIDAPVPQPGTVPMRSLAKVDYDALGGFLIGRSGIFRSGLCRLHLAGYSQFGENEKHSDLVSIDGVFPALVQYTIQKGGKGGAFRGQGKSRRRLITKSQENLGRVRMQLQWAPDFLPLSSTDGRTLGEWEIACVPNEDQVVDLPDYPESGYVRLVLSDPTQNVAIIDPQLEVLRVEPS